MGIYRREGESIIATPKRRGDPTITITVAQINLEERAALITATTRPVSPADAAPSECYHQWVRSRSLFRPTADLEFRLGVGKIYHGQRAVPLYFEGDVPYYIDRAEVYAGTPEATRQHHHRRLHMKHYGKPAG